MKSVEKINKFFLEKEELETYLKDNFFQELFDKYENLNFLPIHYDECRISCLDSFLAEKECYNIPLDKIFINMEQLYYNAAEELEYVDGIVSEDFTMSRFKDNLQNQFYNGILLHVNSKNYGLSCSNIYEIHGIIKSAESFLPLLTDEADASLIVRNGKNIEIIKKYI